MSCMRIFLLCLLALTGCRSSKPATTTLIRTKTTERAVAGLFLGKRSREFCGPLDPAIEVVV